MGIVNNGIDGRGNSKLGIVNGWRDMRCVAEMSDTLIDSLHPEMGQGNITGEERRGGEACGLVLYGCEGIYLCTTGNDSCALP